MNTIFNNLKYFINRKDVTNEEWEHFYRTRWAHDKEVRSTHGVNCTGSCSWRIFVKKGIVTWRCNRLITLRHVLGYPIMNRAVAHVVPATAGISITPDV